MSVLFTLPIAFYGLMTLPALVAIYWLRTRYRKLPVSSLMLWRDARIARQGGTRIHQLQMPLLFFLELLALLLLVLAAAGFQIHGGESSRPLVIVLDDSFSMQAGGANSPRALAIKSIEEELRQNIRSSIRLILAGERPQALGEPVQSIGEALNLLNGWKCTAPTAALDESVAFASEIGGEYALLLVVTDHAPEKIPETGRLQWRAFGQPRPNVAFVNAVRSSLEGTDRCLLEIANLANDARDTTLIVEAGQPPTEVQRSLLHLEPKETRRILLKLPNDTSTLHARLSEDDLAVDNEVSLQPMTPRVVRVEVKIGDERINTLVEKVTKAARSTLLTDNRPELLFTDDETIEAGPNTWIVHLLSEKEAEAFSGPFILDRTHPLAEGLSLQGVIWGSGKTKALPGSPILMAGDIPLITDTETPMSGHELRLRWRPDLSTLQNAPAWPVLIANLIDWRASAFPGLSRSNIRLGGETVLTLPETHDEVHCIRPDGTMQTLAVHGKRVVIHPEEVGVHTVETGGTTYTFSVNPLNRDESDLTNTASGRWGDWIDATTLRLEYQDITWLLLLLVLAVLTLHWFLIANDRGRLNA